MDRWVDCPLIWLGVKRARSKKIARRGQPHNRESHLYEVRVGHLSRYSQLLLLPVGVPPMPAPARSTQSLSQGCGVWRVLTTTDKGNVTQGQGVPDHQVLPISHAQHTQTFCHLFRWFTARAVCQLAPPKALQWGVGSYALPAFALPRPYCGA